MTDPLTTNERCTQCNMQCEPGEYHPYAACLMYMQCVNSETVRANLAAVVEHGRAAHEPLTDHMAALIDSAYYEGAKLALIKADESIQVAREWLAGGCNGRRQAALAILRHAPPPEACYHEDRYAGWVCMKCNKVMGECPPMQPAPPPNVQEDAERYRYLCSLSTENWQKFADVMDNEIDAAIDAARAAEAKGDAL